MAERAAAVHSMGEFGYVVRGEPDLDQACLLLGRRYLEDHWWGEDEPTQLPPVYEAGWYRWTPCNPRSCWDSGGHMGHLNRADGPGRGVWWGIWFDWGWA